MPNESIPAFTIWLPMPFSLFHLSTNLDKFQFGFDGDDNTLDAQNACEAYMEGIHVGFDRRICTDASSKSLPIATYCLRSFHRLGTNPTVKTALHLPWSDFRASFGAEDAGIQEYSKDDKPEITGNRPCQAARIPFMYAPVFSPSLFVLPS